MHLFKDVLNIHYVQCIFETLLLQFPSSELILLDIKIVLIIISTFRFNPQFSISQNYICLEYFTLKVLGEKPLKKLVRGTYVAWLLRCQWSVQVQLLV